MRKTEGVSCRLDPEERRRARILAATRDISLGELLRQGLRRLLDEAEREQAAQN